MSVVTENGNLISRNELRGEAALRAQRELERAESLPDLWQFAAEPWLGPLPAWQRLQLAMKMSHTKYVELAHSWKRDNGQGHSISQVEKLVRGDRPLRREHVHAFAAVLDVSVPWISRGIAASAHVIGFQLGDDYFQLTPDWLHPHLEQALRLLGNPRHEALRRSHTIEGLRGQVSRSPLPPAVKGDQIICGDLAMIIESGAPPITKRMDPSWWAPPGAIPT